MTTYVCVRDFTTGLGKRYHLGIEITDTQYAILSFNDKLNFRKKEEPAAYSREAESFIPSPFDHVLGLSSQVDDSLADNSPSFGGFGGGDFGGGGASGSWNDDSSSSDSSSSFDSGGDSGSGGGGGE